MKKQIWKEPKQNPRTNVAFDYQEVSYDDHDDKYAVVFHRDEGDIELSLTFAECKDLIRALSGACAHHNVKNVV
jgi:hypothetical protein